MWVLLSNLVSKRTIGLLYLCWLLLLINIITRYVINLFVVFCVIYTITDLYKKRKKYMWIVKIIIGNIKFLSYTIIGETTINNILFIKPKKVRVPKASKN